MQKYVNRINANRVDLVKSFPTSIYLQKSASVQPRTSPSKFGGKYSILFTSVLTAVPFSVPCFSSAPFPPSGEKAAEGPAEDEVHRDVLGLWVVVHGEVHGHPRHDFREHIWVRRSEFPPKVHRVCSAIETTRKRSTFEHVLVESTVPGESRTGGGG